MSTRKPTKKAPVKAGAKRPTRAHDVPKTHAELVAMIAERRDRPIAKAWGKLYDFVNATVSDPDFRHPDSRALFEFLLLVRDEMTDGINEEWSMDDIFAPMVEALHRYQGRQAKGKPKPTSRTPLRRGLELLVLEGFDNDAIFLILGDADNVSHRARNGFPFEVCDPETTLREDKQLSYYETGGSSDQAKSITFVELQKLLSRVRRSQQAA